MQYPGILPHNSMCMFLTKTDISMQWPMATNCLLSKYHSFGWEKSVCVSWLKHRCLNLQIYTVLLKCVLCCWTYIQQWYHWHTYCTLEFELSTLSSPIILQLQILFHIQTIFISWQLSTYSTYFNTLFNVHQQLQLLQLYVWCLNVCKLSHVYKIVQCWNPRIGRIYSN